MRRASTTRRKTLREQRRTEAASLYLRGLTQAEIADRVGVDQATVSRDLKRVQAEWREARLDDVDTFRVRELARIDEVERELWSAWAQSRNAGKPNPAFLQGVARCIDQRSKILGLNAPPETARTEIEFSLADAFMEDTLEASNERMRAFLATPAGRPYDAGIDESALLESEALSS